MKRFGLLIIALVFIISSCKKDKPLAEPTVSINNLYGQWHWVESRGGFTNVPTTSKNTGYEVYRDYDTERNFKEYHNADIFDQEKFSLSKLANGNPSDSLYLITYSPSAKGDIIFTAKRDTLLVSEYRAGEGFTSRYVRMR